MQPTYNLWLVALSVGMAIFVACTALKLAARLATAQAPLALRWLIGGAVVLGTGIWSTHFIAMLAFELPIELRYDISMTLLSLCVAIATAAFALKIASAKKPSLTRLSASALVIGLGISAVHYSGMTAIQIVPTITYERGLLFISLLIATVASFAALWLAFKLRDGWSWQVRAGRFGAVIVMGLAISGMHYAGMAAANFSPQSYCVGGMPLDGASLSVIVVLFTCGLLTAALITALFDARLEARIQLHIDELAAANAHLRHVAMHDALTGLPNRTLLLDRLNQSILAAEQRQEQFAVLTLNLDRFKTVNDSLGYGAGDELLQQVTRRLTGIVRADDTLARSGGDEFVVVMNSVHDMADVESAAQLLIRELGKRFAIHPHQVHTSPSIGISVFPADGRTADSLLACSTESLRHAKKLGRNTYQFFAQGMSTFSQENLELENELRHALELKQFQLYYQPKIDVATDEIIGVEALLRWFHPRMGSIGPDRFIPLAEETGLMLPIGEWIMREACQQAHRWQEAGLPFLRMAVNLSATQFQQSNLETIVRSALKDADLEPQVLELELTESSVMTNPEESAVTLEKLSAAGVLVAIDDFGKGYSSMSYLQRFPIDKLKIDRSFIKDLTVNPNSAAIVTAIISLAHSLRLKVVAEGVESYGQLDHLRQAGCDHYQGYLCSRAVPPDELEGLVRGKKARRALPTAREEECLRTHSRLATYSPVT